MGQTWFAMHTRHQHELKVSQILSNKGFETFLPIYQAKRQWSDRKKSLYLPLFPGYVFVAQIGERRYDVLNTQGVAAIVSTAGIPSEIAEEEIDVVRKCATDSTKVEPHPYMQIGDEVRVCSGPLTGTYGFLVRKKDSYRLVVCVEILGRAASVELGAADLEPASILQQGSMFRVS